MLISLRLSPKTGRPLTGPPFEGTSHHSLRRLRRAFVELDDGSFGKSSVGDVDVVAPGPITGVSLVLPAKEDLWSPEMQRALAPQLVALSDRRFAVAAKRLERVEKALESCDGASDPSCQVLEAWKENEALWVNWMADENERLSDPEEQLDAFRDAWLNQY